MNNNNKWKKYDKKVINFESSIMIPNWRLDSISNTNLRKNENFDKIPTTGGCYWIWTNEKIKHSLHNSDIPKKFSGGEIIYNGKTNGNVQARIRHHLLGELDAGWSGVSIDLYPKKSKSHRKKIMHTRGKVPFLNGKGITTIEQTLKLNLSRSEKNYIKKHKPPFFFRNGINIFDKKKFKFI